MKSQLDATVLALLGPRTAEDEAMLKAGKKNKKKVGKEKAKKKKVEAVAETKEETSRCKLSFLFTNSCFIFFYLLQLLSPQLISSFLIIL